MGGNQPASRMDATSGRSQRNTGSGRSYTELYLHYGKLMHICSSKDVYLFVHIVRSCM